MATKTSALALRGLAVREKVSALVLAAVVKVPQSREPALADTLLAQARSHALARSAARRASLMASTMALPPGVLGWITFLPELVAVWRMQGQMVADIAATYGKTGSLTREQMLYCLFKQLSAQALRDVVVRAGERFVVRKASGALLQNVAQKIGVQLTQKMLGKGVSRFVPLIGAVGVGAYAYFDTLQVGKAAMELFSHDIELEERN